jgi:GPH family glycoside/pentoside/hexuronide:cation symporter
MKPDRLIPDGKLPFSVKAFYGSGTVAFGIKEQGFTGLLMLYYNQVVGLPAAWVGAAIMIAMVVDALVDPLIGQASDDLRTKWGRRHPFMYAAAIPIAVAYFFLWTPPHLGHEAMFAYLVVAAIVVRLAISLYEIPSTALLAEFTSDYDERTTLVAYRYFFGVVAGVVIAIVTFRYFLVPTAAQPAGALNPDGYVTYGLVAGAVMLASVLISTLGTHSRIPTLRVDAKPERKSFLEIVSAMKAVLFDKTYAAILLASLFFAMSAGLTTSLTLYFNTYFWGLSAAQIATLSSAGFAGILLAFAVAVPLSKIFGKKQTATVLFILSALSGATPLTLRMLDLFPNNGSGLLLVLLMVQLAFTTMCSISASILAVSMVADVGEQIQLRTGRRAEGLMFSAVIMVNKAVSGMGVLISGLLLAAVAFPEHAQPGQVPAEVLSRLAVTYIVVALSLSATAILALSRYPITRAHHVEALRQLKENA